MYSKPYKGNTKTSNLSPVPRKPVHITALCSDCIGMTHSRMLSLLICPLVLVTSFDLKDNQKRWVVIGICLNRLLLPVLRDFVGQEIPKHYTSLKSAHGIDTQVYGPHLIRDGSFQLNYGSINNNWGSFKKRAPSYDYKVNTAEDLAKLYLEPHMAKFTGNLLLVMFHM